MALARKTVKLIAIVVLSLIVVAVVLGLLLGFLLKSDIIHLEVLPQGVVSFRAKDKSTYLPWVQSLNGSLQSYSKKAPGAENRVACSFNTGPLGDKQVCDVPLDEFTPCTASNLYNYQEGSPCVFLKLNKISNWTPKPYNSTNDLPGDMPEELKRHIKSVNNQAEANEVWVSCEGEGDKSNVGPIRYIPRHGFPAYYFSSAKKEGYLSPLVAVMFEAPKNGTLVNVVCKAWAKNIACEGCEQTASVRFQLSVTN